MMDAVTICALLEKEIRQRSLTLSKEVFLIENSGGKKDVSYHRLSGALEESERMYYLLKNKLAGLEKAKERETV